MDIAAQDYLRMVAHDIKNPLTCIMGYAQLMSERPENAVANKVAIARILSCARWANAIVGDLVDASAIERGSLSVDKSLIDLCRVTRDCVQAHEVLFSQKGVALELRLPPHQVQLMGDAVRLAQAVNNLLANALKHVPKGGRVAVIVHDQSGQAVVEVKDDGIGIAAEHLERIFEQHYQVVTDGRGNLGLGLYIARALISAHGGRLSAASGGLGKGASFFATLPKFNPERSYQAYRAARAEETPVPRVR